MFPRREVSSEQIFQRTAVVDCYWSRPYFSRGLFERDKPQRRVTLYEKMETRPNEWAIATQPNSDTDPPPFFRSFVFQFRWCFMTWDHYCSIVRAISGECDSPMISLTFAKGTEHSRPAGRKLQQYRVVKCVIQSTQQLQECVQN